MPDPVAPLIVRGLVRRALPWAAAAVVVGGGARLAHDQVRLAGVSQQAASLEGRLSQQAGEAQRAARLELDLAVLREDARAREDQLARARARVGDLEVAVEEAAAALAALEAARDEARARAEAHGGALGEARRDLAAREADLGQARRELDARTRLLREVEAAAAEQARELGRVRGALMSTEAALEVATQRGAALEADLTAERRLARERAEAVATLHDKLGEAEAALREVDARARRDAERLARLARAGVNVARLTGERPMPDVRALVVQVDLDVVPPLVVFDAGDGAGVERGDVLVVRRDGNEVARLEVDEVRGHYSAARVVRAQRGVRVRPGDQVRTP
ncbi:MAG: hypothetical protein M9894_02065 [Planctomycetes bacterium]|nr:hypothetical protein [Planctomycetota bacterium]